MKKTTLLGVMAGLCLWVSAQQQTIQPLTVGDTVPDITFTHLINYPNKTAKLSDFKGKVVILDFWFTTCTGCIRDFPKLQEIQATHPTDVQIILVAHETKEKVSQFIKNWEKKNNTQFSLPIVTDDTLLHNLIRHTYEGHLAWISPQGRLLAQSSPSILNLEVMTAYLNILRKEKQLNQ
ncbi:MAG: TlpA disulfide reductase family protein [Niabella sp.]